MGKTHRVTASVVPEQLTTNCHQACAMLLAYMASIEVAPDQGNCHLHRWMADMHS